MSKSIKLVLARLAVATSVLAALSAHADLNSEAQQMFNDLGAIGNVTTPGAFRGQTMNTYTGGALMLRSPNKVYQLATIQFPYVRAGCGGIDAFGGSFSHMSSQEFKNVLKNITSALPGVAFQLALSSVSPLLGEKVQWIKSLETFVNNARINSCETAQALVRGAANQAGFDANASCRRIALAMGVATDEDDAREKCRTNQASLLDQARNSGNPDAKAMAPFVGNLIWTALKRVTSLTDEEREMVMNFTGTAVYYPESQQREPDVYAPTLSSLADLLYGRADAGGGNVFVKYYKCGDFASCTTLTEVPNYTFEPFTTKVEKLMRSLSDKIATRSNAPTPQEIGFVNSVNEPVYRMLSIGNAVKGSGQADILITRYRDVIAVDYTYTFLDRELRQGLDAILTQWKLSLPQQEQAKALRERIAALLVRIGQERTAAHGKVQSFAAIASHLEQLERQLRTSMPQHVIDLVGYSTPLPGR
jgi:conjugative transfer pilus assembly protein TraH